MDSKTTREVVATLIKANRRDLAKHLVTAGYTHHWAVEAEFNDEQWKQILAGAKKIIAAAKRDKIEIVGPLGKGKPDLTPVVIALNGAGKDSHESFLLRRRPGDWFCKTARKPYDKVVVSILALAKNVAPETVTVSSDGGGNVFAQPPYPIKVKQLKAKPSTELKGILKRINDDLTLLGTKLSDRHLDAFKKARRAVITLEEAIR